MAAHDVADVHLDVVAEAEAVDAALPVVGAGVVGLGPLEHDVLELLHGAGADVDGHAQLRLHLYVMLCYVMLLLLLLLLLLVLLV